MKTKHYFRILTGSLLAVLATFFLSETKLYAQDDSQRDREERQNRAAKIDKDNETESDAATDHEKDWPQKLTLVAGGGLNYNWANGPYQIDNNSYDVGHGYGPEFHLGLEAPIGGSWMFAPRFDYSVLATTMTDGVPVGGAAPLSNFATDVRTIGFDVLFKYSINRVHFLLGPYASYMIKKTYAHGEFGDADASTTKIPGIHDVFVSAGGGVGYDAPLNSKNTMWLTPEIFYSYPITNLGAGDLANDNNVSHLKTSTLRGALSLKFDISPSEPPPAPPPPQMRPVSVTVTAKGVLPNGQATNEPVLPEKTIYTRASVPLVPYVFFDEKSAVIPARYSQNGATGFDEKQLDGKDAMVVNHAVLDVVGERMKENPDIMVTITGTNCNTGAEKHNIKLSKERAMAVRDYLVNTWGINSDRIKTDARDLPELATNPSTPAGIEENRRAEIDTSDSKITDPVKIENTKSEFDGETLIRYETTVTNPDNIALSHWRITLDDNGTMVGSAESGSGAPPAIIPSKIPDASHYEGQPLHYTLEVTDVNGKTATADGMCRVERATTKSEKFLESYAMLSFDFDSSIVNEHAKRMLSLISESIKREALGVGVNGYCDITGTDEYNQVLSERRANSAADALRGMTNMPDNVTITGHGRQDPKFPNDLPEGRQLNRRVEVEIEKSQSSAEK